ncbi:MAG: BON domain-containing protein [Verrucomicrobiota bacterium]
MKLFTARMAGLLLFLLSPFLSGCVTTERDVLASQDLTSEIIRQGTDLYMADKELSRAQIDLDGFHGAMRLRGQVATATLKERAAQIVWALRGVRSVQNDLTVSPPH